MTRKGIKSLLPKNKMNPIEINFITEMKYVLLKHIEKILLTRDEYILKEFFAFISRNAILILEYNLIQSLQKKGYYVEELPYLDRNIHIKIFKDFSLTISPENYFS